jgi:hypothetical protein
MITISYFPLGEIPIPMISVECLAGKVTATLNSNPARKTEQNIFRTKKKTS